MLQNLFDKLQDEFNVSIKHKGVGVYTLELSGFDLEFSSPRIEIFKAGEIGHLNFEPKFISNLSTAEAFKRRDFTFNAIGIFFGVAGADDEFTIVDPYNGVDALEAKELRAISSDFFLDPVRFLRMIRFSEKFNFSIGDSLKKELGKFNLQGLGIFHFYQEFKKSKSINFFSIFFKLVLEHNISLSKEIEKLRFLKDLRDISTGDRGELFFALQSFTIEQKTILIECFNLKKKLFQGYLKSFQIIEKYRHEGTIDEELVSTFEVIYEANLATEFSIIDEMKYREFLTLIKNKPKFQNQNDKNSFYQSLVTSLARQNSPK
ncbi:tRNA cytidylyltransferase family protein [Bacteriovorax sp. Seq25_V]|nr:tRNA cytidylyltransferase family protein [Bacteriovorax sp. Seq25_V]